MDIFEKARELGNLLLETEEGKKLNDKKYIFDGNDEAKRKLYEYSRYREGVQVKFHSGELTDEDIKAEQENMKKKIDEVMADPIISDMFKAEEEFSTLVNQVMAVLRATIEGTSEGGCTGSCSSCGGCH